MSETRIVKEELPHSVKIAINAKGQYSGECKVYADSPDAAFMKSLEISNKLEQVIRAKNKL